jgi:hypothetical protein
MKKKLIYLFSLATVCLLIFYLSSIFFATAFLSSNHLRIGDPPENFQAEKVSFKTGDGLTYKRLVFESFRYIKGYNFTSRI